MKYSFPSIVCIVCLVFSYSVNAQSIRAGVGKEIITPPLPYLLTGYAGRTFAADKKVHDLWAKSLLLKSGNNKVVIVTTDVLGLTPEIHKELLVILKKKFNLENSQILINSSHTHSGPMIWPSLEMIGDYNDSTIKKFREYKNFLVEKIVESVKQAHNNMFDAKLSSGHGTAAFAMNRREWKNGKVINGKNPKGNIDHDVPVLKVENMQGTVKAILFGYACHNTTVTGQFNIINGDYAGFAQIELEKAYPQSTALFFTGCAGDQNPQPRGSLELAEMHGKELATSVKNVLSNKLKPINGNIHSNMTYVPLQFVPFDYDKYAQALESSNVYEKRRARLMLQAYNRGWDVTRYPYPLQTIRIGKDITFVSMAGEVVVDYSLNIKKRYPKENFFIAAYCNYVMGYIPTKKILEEGGYEANENLIYYGMPGPFEKNIESKIFSALDSLLKEKKNEK